MKKSSPKSTLNADRSNVEPTLPKSPHGTSSSPPSTPRRFSTSSSRSYETTDYYTSPINQRVSTTMSLYGYNRGNTRRVSINSSISNFSTMSETSLPWTTKDIGFNAISGVLNDPSANPSSSWKPSKSDIPAVPHTSIRKVKPSDFDNYIKSIKPVFERYSRNKELSDERQKLRGVISEPPESPTTNLLNIENAESEDVPAHRQASSRNPYSVSLPSSPITEDHPPEPEIELPLLELVPSVYFEPDFNLENPRTFDTVCEQADMISSNPAISTNAILQEKLSHYLDTVEVHLVKEISRKSSSFFAALSNLQVLHSETLECVSQINTLRQKLARSDESEAKKGLEVIRLKRRRSNLRRLCEGIRLVAEIRSTRPMIQVFLDQGDYFSALDLIEESDRILQGEGLFTQFDEKGTQNSSAVAIPTTTPSKMIRRLSNVSEGLKSGKLDLQGVRALVHFGGQLADMRKMISIMMENELLDMIFLDFSEHLENINNDEVINTLYKFKYSISQSKKPTPLTASILLSEIKENKLQQRIAPLIIGLYKMDRFAVTLQAYRERILKQIKNVIQKHYPSSLPLSDLDQGQSIELKLDSSISSSFGKVLKGMTFDAFMKVLLELYAILIEGIKRISVYNQLFIATLSDARNAGVQIQKEIQTIITEEQESSNIDDNKTDETSATTGKHDEMNTTTRQTKLLSAQKITSGLKSIIQKASASASRAISPTPLDNNTPDKETERMTSPPKLDPTNNYTQLVTESSDIVFAVADLAHVRCANLIAVRSEQNARLNPKDFYRLFNVTWAFVLEGESLCGRMCFGLRGTIMSQAKSFLTHFHMEKINSAASVIDNEQWVQTEVPVDFQRIVNGVVAASIGGMSDFKDDLLADPSMANPLSPSYQAPPMKLPTSDGVTNQSTNTTTTTTTTSNRVIFVEGQRFIVVACSLMLLKTLGEYLRCMVNIPVLTIDAMNRILEILNLFNSRTCQVILGAGAMVSAGLKNITAKHLALASQSLGLMIALIPFIRESIRHNLNAKQILMLTEFDRIKRNYIEHQNEVHVKLVSIMKDRLAVYVRSIQSVQWDDPNAEAGPNPYMEMIVKETTTLHKVLNKYLPPEILQKVMAEIFEVFNAKLIEEIQKFKITTADGKKRLLVDVSLYTRKLSRLENVKGPKDDIEVAAKEYELKDAGDPLTSESNVQQQSTT